MGGEGQYLEDGQTHHQRVSNGDRTLRTHQAVTEIDHLDTVESL